MFVPTSPLQIHGLDTSLIKPDISPSFTSGSSTPYTKLAMVDFASIFIDGRNKQAKNLVSTSFQLVKLWLR